MDLATQGADLTVTPEAVACDPRVGTMLGPYRILECIGDGGMGRVYRAEHVHLERPAAIKFLLTRFATDEEAVSRFLQEAKTVNRVRHPNLIDIYDYFVEHEQALVAYVMELLTGRSLRDAMVQDTLGMARILPIARQLCGALHAVHGVGIVHRDLKPENVYLIEGADGAEVVKVLDFGVAKFTRGQVTHRTQAGMAMGSPWYMAPEQARGANVDHRADVYSFGVILYELLTGRVPFPGDTYAAVLGGHLGKTPPPLRRRDGWIPPDAVSGFVLRCLEKDPTARPADMDAAWQELAEAAGPQFAGAWATPAGLRVGRTPRLSRITLPLTGSDPPLRLTPVEGAPEVAGEGPSESRLPVAIPPTTELVVAIVPSDGPSNGPSNRPSNRPGEGPPAPIPAVVLRPLPRKAWRVPLWGWAAVGALVALVALLGATSRRPSPTAAVPVATPQPAPSAARLLGLAQQVPALAATDPAPASPPVPLAHEALAQAAPAPAPAATPNPPTAAPHATPRAHPARSAAARGPARPKPEPARNTRDAILDPFQ
jgi:eukaryotic-like serine/threonine-protein kinase